MNRSINNLLQRIQPLMETVDLKNMDPDLNGSINTMTKKTGVSSPDYVKRLLVLSNNGLLTNDEYVGLIVHFSKNPPLEACFGLHCKVEALQTATNHSYA